MFILYVVINSLVRVTSKFIVSYLVNLCETYPSPQRNVLLTFLDKRLKYTII